MGEMEEGGVGWPLGYKLGSDGARVRDHPLRIPPTGSSPPLASGHRHPGLLTVTLWRSFAPPTLSLHLFGLPEKGPGTAMNRKEAVESLGALMGLKGLGTRWVFEPECGGGREGSPSVGLGMFTKPSQIPERSMRSLEVLEFGAGSPREKK